MDASLMLFAVVIVGLTAFVLGKKRPSQTVTVDVKGERVYRSAESPDGLVATPDTIATMHESFEQAVKKYGDKKCIGTRKQKGKDSWGDYEWKTFKQMNSRGNNFGSGLINLGAKPGDRIGIFSKNREEWFVTQQACFSQSLVIVSFYETLGKDSIRYVADHAEMVIAVCNGESLSKMFEVIQGKEGYKGLRYLIVMDTPDNEQEARNKAKELDVELRMFDEVEKDGEKNEAKLRLPKVDDLCTIMYTSGTTGTPKGVPLTHANVVAELAGIMRVYDVPPDTCHLSYLPLAHIFERVILFACIHKGGCVGFFHGDTQKGLADDLKALKPTVFIGVPKVYEKTKDAILSKVKHSNILARIAFHTAFAIKKFAILHAKWVPTGLLDKLVFDKTKEAVGGNVKLMISAGAPLSLSSETFLRVCFGIPVSQGYGLTETCGASTFKRLNDSSVGHQGAPMPMNELKLADLKDMGYTTKDKPNPRGELLIRGPNVAQGYYKDDKKTKESFKEGGWFETGDIAEFSTHTGTFKIVDRKKNLLKLAQGEYVAVETVEEKLTKECDNIEQLYLHGDSQQSFLVAIVVPKKGGAKDGGDKKQRDEFKKQLEEAGRKAGLQGFEIPRNAVIAKEQFTQENDLMTPTMKLKRNAIADKYKKEIEQMYKEGGGSRGN